MAEFRQFDIPGAFAKGRQNALAIDRQEQLIASERQNAPLRNQLNQTKLQSAQLGLQQKQQGADQQDALQKAQVINQAAQALKKLPEQQRPQALAKMEGMLEEFGIPRGQFSPEQLTQENIDNTIIATGAFIQSKGEPQSFAEVLRQQQLDFDKQKEKRLTDKLSGGLEKALLDSQDAVTSAQRSSSEFDILAKQVEGLGGGVITSTSELFKKLLGTQDDVTEFRRRFNSVRLSEGLRNLPPGPATDKDMAEAFKGVPAENAPGTQIASFLRGAAKMARFDAAYNQFKSDFISEQSTAKGLNKEWRRSVDSSVLGRSVTIAEIYAEAAAEGVTPEDVMSELGIQ